MAILITGELVVLRFAMHNLSAVRAFVAGEGGWSKAQKDAALSLQQYALTHREENYTSFLDNLKLPDGDHRARMELLKANPDLGVVHEGFLAGKIHPDDIEPMVQLLRRFYWISYMARAIRAWTVADGLLAELRTEGALYHDLMANAFPDAQRAEQSLKRITSLNAELTQAEDEFSEALGEGSRWMERLVISLLFLAVLTVESIGLTLTFTTSRNISKSLRNLNGAAERIGRGQFEHPLEVDSQDELGRLTEDVNRMGVLLQKSYSDLESRVQARTIELTQMATENARLYEEAKAAIQARDDFMSIASHELRTPLTALYLQLQMAARASGETKTQEEDPRVARMLEGSLSGARRLASLVDELLDLTRLRAGKMILRREEADLTQLVREATAQLEPDARQAGVTIGTRLVEPIQGSFDPTRMGQVIMNLLTNGIKYGGGNPIEVSVERQGPSATIRVRDSGPGISPDHQARIFERFERATDDRSISGLGLGLYITRQIVEAHEGDISVTSQLGLGTEFVVHLPLQSEAGA